MREQTIRTADEWFAWVEKAQPGDQAVYHRGPSLNLDSRGQHAEHGFAGIVRQAAERGLVILFQRRMTPPPGAFEFVARRLSIADADAIARAERARQAL